MKSPTNASPVRHPCDQAAIELDASLDEFSRQLGRTQWFIQRELLEFEKDQDNGHLFAIIHALKELIGMQAQPAARMAAHINVLQQAAALRADGEADTLQPSPAPVLQLETSLLLAANRIDESGRGRYPRVELMKDWGKTSYEMQIAREAGDLNKRIVALQAAYDLAKQACSNAHSAPDGRIEHLRH
jgi:hypothetical protein